MADAERRLHGWLSHGLDAMVVMLVVLRPLVYGGEPGGVNTIWCYLLVIGWGVLVLERLLSPRPTLHWSWTAVLALAAWLVGIGGAIQAADPAAGWGWWTAWGFLLAFGFWLMQIIKGREQLVAAALGGALVVQALLVWGQQTFAIPEMREHGAEAAGLPAHLQWVLEDRLDHGGAYGTTTLGNMLAAMAVLVGLPFAAAAIADLRHQRTHWSALFGHATVTIAAIVCLVSAGAKGPVVALGAALAWLLCRRFIGRWAWVLVGIATLIAIIGIIFIGEQQGIDSFTVRLHYWRAAIELWWQAPITGIGFGGYEAEAATALPPTAEYARHAHHVIFEVLTEAGIIAAALVSAVLLRLLWVQPGRQSVTPGGSTTVTITAPDRRWPAWLPLVVLPLATTFGVMISDNLIYWPGGHDPAGQALWAFLLGAAATLVMRPICDLQAPPPWALGLGLAAYVVCTCLDFHAHELGVLGTAITIAVLAGAHRQRIIELPWVRAVPVVLWPAVILIGMIAWNRMQQLASVDAILDQIAATMRTARHLNEPMPAERRQQLQAELQVQVDELGWLTGIHDRPQRRGDMERFLTRAWQTARDRAQGWPASATISRRLAEAAPPLERLTSWQAAQELAPRHFIIWAGLAKAQAAEGNPVAGLDALRRARRLSPWNMGLAETEIKLLRQLAVLRPDEAAKWRDEADCLHDWMSAFWPVVHYAHRLGANPPDEIE